MVRNEVTLDVLVASPSDVGEERSRARSVITEVNSHRRWSSPIRLEPFLAEDDAVPGIAGRTQEVVNRQIGSRFDIFVGILWNRFGRPTGQAESGTEEEFRQAYKRWNEDSESVSIMLYFKTAGPTSMDEVDPEQLAKVRAFKEEINETTGILWKEFTDAEDFERKLRTDLSKKWSQWEKRYEGKSDEQAPHDDGGPTSPDDTRPNSGPGQTRAKREAEGLLDLIEEGLTKSRELEEITDELGGLIEELGSEIEDRTHELEGLELQDPTNVATARRISLRAASNLHDYSEGVKAKLPTFSEVVSGTLNSWSRAAVILREDFPYVEQGEVEKAYRQSVELRKTLEETYEVTSEFRDAFEKMPRLSSRFTKEKSNAAQVTDKLVAELNSAVETATEIEGQFGDWLDNESNPHPN